MILFTKMKLHYLVAAPLVFLLGATRSPNTNLIAPEKLTGNISLELKHGVWWFAKKDKPVYQTMILSVMCNRGECRPTVWGYAPRFTGEIDHIGSIETVKRDNAWHLKIKMTIDSPGSKQKKEAIYAIQVVPDKDGWIGNYWGNFQGKDLQNKVRGTVTPLPQLIANGKSRQLQLAAESFTPPTRYPLSNHRVYRNLPYRIVNRQVLSLDFYQKKVEKATPVLIAIHGGGWQSGKRSSFKFLEPYLAMGFSVVDISYRLTDTALAPGAIEDCSCALGWIIQNAKKYNFDLNKIVVTGYSAGGHLALTTGMISPSSQLQKQCPDIKTDQVAAIINWIGPTDVVDLIEGPNRQDYAVAWIGSQANRKVVAKKSSPIHYVRKNLPPILSIHGDLDRLVPYEQAVRLHQALNKVSVPNEFLTIREREHGNFNREENRQSYATIEDFLRRYKILE
jgi:acetyl esterase/lipase